MKISNQRKKREERKFPIKEWEKEWEKVKKEKKKAPGQRNQKKHTTGDALDLSKSYKGALKDKVKGKKIIA